MNTIDITKLEQLCVDLCSSTSETVIKNQVRTSSSQTLQSFLETESNFSVLFSILPKTSNTHLLYLCLTYITKQLSTEWKNFSLSEKSMIYSTLFSMLGQNNESHFFIGGVCKALARVCRLGWTELEEPEKAVENIESLLVSSPSYLMTAFKFFIELITEISEPIKGRSLSVNRKTGVLFRDNSLGRIFSYSLQVINNNMQTISQNLLYFVLTATNLCLGFDFLGVSQDETSEDSICLQVPASWKTHFENPVFFSILEFIIINSFLDVEVLACRILNHVGAIRKSIFFGSLDLRQNYISHYLGVTERIMCVKQLEDNSLFEFINGIKRFLNNFGLKEVSANSNFKNWLERMAKYSLELFKRPEAVYSGSESSMAVWSYIAFESHLQLNEEDFSISGYVKGIFESFLMSSLKNVLADFDIEKESEIKEHLELISTFSIYYYSEIVNILEVSYRNLINSHDIYSQPRQSQLAWIIHIASGFISVRDGKNCEGDLDLDASLIRLVFECMSKVSNPVVCLEVSYLLFITGLAKSYINSSTEKIWIVLDNTQDSLDTTINNVLDLVLDYCFKIMTTSSDTRLLNYVLVLLDQLAKGYYSIKYMLKNERVLNFMIQYSTYPLCLNFPKLHGRVFNVLVHLWMNEELSTPIEIFLTPLEELLKITSESGHPGQFELAFKELEGICAGLNNQKNYLDFFEWFFYRFGVVVSACQFNIYNDQVMSSLLKFLLEITHNRNSRIKFDLAYNYGIVFFKNISTVITVYGKVILDNSSSPDYFLKFYGKIRRHLGIMTNLISGSYVPFGVFGVYSDTSYCESLQICFTILDTLPMTELTSYQKLLDIIYDFIEVLCKSHLKTVFTELTPKCFSQILTYLTHGIRITNMKHCASTSASINSLCEYIIKVSQKKFPEMKAVQERVSETEYLFVDLFRNVVEVIILEDSNFMWSLSKPLLGLIIVNEPHFENIKNFVLGKVSCSNENLSKLREAMAGLMNGVSRTMDSVNRDRFGKNFSGLRQIISSIYE